MVQVFMGVMDGVLADIRRFLERLPGLYTQVVQSDDHLTDAFLAAREAGHNFTALEAAARLLARDPRSPSARLRYGNALRDVLRFSDAEKVLLDLNDDDPNDGLTAEFLGGLYREWDRPADAERWYRRACELRSDHTGPWIFLGVVLIRLERLAEAETALRRALQAEGDRDEAWMNLGNVRLLLGDVGDARRCYVQALALCPDYPAAQRRLDDLDAMNRLQAGGR